MIPTGLFLMIVCACILHWGHKRQALEVAAMGMWAGLVIVLAGMVELVRHQ